MSVSKNALLIVQARVVPGIFLDVLDGCPADGGCTKGWEWSVMYCDGVMSREIKVIQRDVM